MLAQELKRCLSFLLALVMVFSMVPVQAFATEDVHDHVDSEEGIVQEAGETELSEEEAPAPQAEEAHDHSYTSVVTAASCTQAGFTTYACECGDSYVAEETEALGHSYEFAVVDPTYEADGYTQYTCTACGDSYSDNVIPKLQPEAPAAPEMEPITTPAEVDEEPSALAQNLTARVNAIVADYGVNGSMTEDEIFDAMYAKSDDELFATMDEMEALAEASEVATKADEEYILANVDAQAYGKLCDAMNQLREISLYAATGTHTPVDGVTVGVSGATDNSMSNGAVTVTAKGSSGFLGIGASTKTATITIYNDSDSKANLSFDWTASSVNQLKIDDTVYTGASGSFEKVMGAGESFTVTITTAKNSTVNKLVMSNFAVAAVKASSSVTFFYDSSLGSITSDSAAVENGAVLEISSAGAALKATAGSGATFLGWIDGESTILCECPGQIGAISLTAAVAADCSE